MIRQRGKRGPSEGPGNCCNTEVGGPSPGVLHASHHVDKYVKHCGGKEGKGQTKQGREAKEGDGHAADFVCH